jgi:transposase InsO family protein
MVAFNHNCSLMKLVDNLPAKTSRGVLKENGIRISMDGKGRWVDNVFVERL